MEYLNSFQRDHFVSPAARSTLWYSSHFVLNPTHPNRPLENRLHSLSESMASAIFLFIMRKSLAPSTIWTSESLLIHL